MKIDDSKRENCAIEKSKLDTWKQKIKGWNKIYMEFYDIFF
jgi:hypothetical protein